MYWPKIGNWSPDAPPDPRATGRHRIHLGWLRRPSYPPVIEARIERVEVPVAVACVDPADVPTVPARVGDQLTGDAAHDAGVLAAVDLRLRATLDKVLALMKGCVTSSK